MRKRSVPILNLDKPSLTYLDSEKEYYQLMQKEQIISSRSQYSDIFELQEPEAVTRSHQLLRLPW